MKALLLGGTGPIGIELANLLVNNGWDVTVSSRSPSYTNVNYSFRKGNALDPIFLNSLLSEHWDAIVDFMIYSTEQFKSRHEFLLARTDHYLFLSSARVYSYSEAPITENSKRILDVCSDNIYLATDEYALAKARQEDILINNNADNWTIIRPYITYGNGRFQLGIWEKEEWLYRALRQRKILVSAEMGACLTTLTDARDVAGGIASLTGNRQAREQIFQITSSTSIYWSQATDIYLDSIFRSGRTKPRTSSINIEIFEQLTDRGHQLHNDRMFDRAFNSSKIHQFADLPEFRPPDEGIPFYMNQFLAKPTFGTINWRAEALKDAVTGEVANLNEFRTLKMLIFYYSQRYLGPFYNRLFCPSRI